MGALAMPFASLGAWILALGTPFAALGMRIFTLGTAFCCPGNAKFVARSAEFFPGNVHFPPGNHVRIVRGANRAAQGAGDGAETCDDFAEQTRCGFLGSDFGALSVGQLARAS
jgi:hypothetical protein